MKHLKQVFLLTLTAWTCAAGAQLLPFEHESFEACMSSVERQAQLRVIDDRHIEDLMEEHGPVEVPLAQRGVFAQLVAASPILKGRSIRLLGYNGKFVNAHAAGHDVVAIAAGTWRGPTALPDEEFAAALAHELAHLENRDSLRMACSALVYLGSPDISLAQATRDVREESWGGNSPLARSMAERSHAGEFAADARAVQLLMRAGYCSTGMSKLLQRLTPRAGGFRPSTHPELKARIAALEGAGGCSLKAGVPSTGKPAIHSEAATTD